MTDRHRPRFNITLDSDVKTRIGDIAGELNLSSSRVIEEVLREFIDLYDDDPMVGRRLRKQIEDRKREKNEDDEIAETVRNILDRMDELD